MTTSRSCCGRVLGGGARGGAPAGCCPPCSLFLAAYLQFPCCRRPQTSSIPRLPCGLSLSLLLRRQLPRLLSTPLHLALLSTLSSVLLRPHGNFPLIHYLHCAPEGPLSFISSGLLSFQSSWSPPYSPALPPLCRASFPVRPCISPLNPYPHLRRPSGSCTRQQRPLRLLSCPQTLISLVRKKMLAIGRAGVRHAGRLWAGLPAQEVP